MHKSLRPLTYSCYYMSQAKENYIKNHSPAIILFVPADGRQDLKVQSEEGAGATFSIEIPIT